MLLFFSLVIGVYAQYEDLVVKLTKQNYNDYVAKGNIIIRYWSHSDYTSVAMGPVWNKMANDYKQFRHNLTFAELDCTRYFETCRNGPVAQYPTFKYHAKDPSNFTLFSEDRTETAIANFIGTVHGLTYRPPLSSFRYLTDKNLTETIMDPFQNVLLVMTAEWCTYCHNLKSSMMAAAASFDPSDHVIFAYIDGEKYNTYCGKYHPNGYPTILYFPSIYNITTLHEMDLAFEQRIERMKQRSRKEGKDEWAWLYEDDEEDDLSSGNYEDNEDDEEGIEDDEIYEKEKQRLKEINYKENREDETLLLEEEEGSEEEGDETDEEWDAKKEAKMVEQENKRQEQRWKKIKREKLKEKMKKEGKEIEEESEISEENDDDEGEYEEEDKEEEVKPAEDAEKKSKAGTAQNGTSANSTEGTTEEGEKQPQKRIRRRKKMTLEEIEQAARAKAIEERRLRRIRIRSLQKRRDERAAIKRRIAKLQDLYSPEYKRFRRALPEIESSSSIRHKGIGLVDESVVRSVEKEKERREKEAKAQAESGKGGKAKISKEDKKDILLERYNEVEKYYGRRTVRGFLNWMNLKVGLFRPQRAFPDDRFASSNRKDKIPSDPRFKMSSVKEREQRRTEKYLKQHYDFMEMQKAELEGNGKGIKKILSRFFKFKESEPKTKEDADKKKKVMADLERKSPGMQMIEDEFVMKEQERLERCNRECVDGITEKEMWELEDELKKEANVTSTKGKRGSKESVNDYQGKFMKKYKQMRKKGMCLCGLAEDAGVEAVILEHLFDPVQRYTAVLRSEKVFINPHEEPKVEEEEPEDGVQFEKNVAEEEKDEEDEEDEEDEDEDDEDEDEDDKKKEEEVGIPVLHSDALRELMDHVKELEHKTEVEEYTYVVNLCEVELEKLRQKRREEIRRKRSGEAEGIDDETENEEDLEDEDVDNDFLKLPPLDFTFLKNERERITRLLRSPYVSEYQKGRFVARRNIINLFLNEF
ncbi:Protein disulfide-isomerase [Monocercomonoides exilis]|uniref:Protein disulfide-isomerase n=1 Tax=Monocercomonoides exilis TaxID=2049356 RepID=UPI00355A877C|nr:Protein disulfide-isomerase [Monocercomonoides exilis]|eukprot:MONOS_5669.1-p1 / transcript=MONOS_5669.1 / gene=MONOS_5669 / organism=Monocercomonoides_exilis_PA203 / gene_product=Protein disulfide-isomerase / transcript_product=Protein disulfide-isomerase / location=Mono_scaffold00168:6626-9627(-) / protein_length=983 / sequence_SO=supercontig / SO=protein_coding / is_pseudo=false